MLYGCQISKLIAITAVEPAAKRANTMENNRLASFMRKNRRFK